MNLRILILAFNEWTSAPEPCPSRDCQSTTKDYSVQFIAKARNSVDNEIARNYRILGESFGGPFQPIGNPFTTFQAAQVQCTNSTIWCFKEGTVTKEDSSPATEITEKGAARCKCKAEWHGVDCGQPEMVWRSLFAAKAIVSTERRAKNIFYIIRSTENSLETLEIQLMELIDVVDVFVLCFSSGHAKLVVVERRIRQFLDSVVKLKGHSERVFLRVQREKCSPKTLLNQLSTSLDRRTFSFKDDDLILLSDQDEILNRKAINYLKWYSDGHEMFRFRLKHTVYGYFWQTPRKTILKSAVLKYKLFIQSKYAMDELLLRTENNSQMPTLMVVGDLNHFGGWFCQLCYQPLGIIAYLASEIQTNLTKHKSGVLDEEFVTKLIANGVNIHELLAREGNFEKATVVGGGQMDLVKLYSSKEKHYSPLYVQQSRGHFENVVRNQYASWELDAVDDYNYYN